jgi:hypothetical protein
MMGVAVGEMLGPAQVSGLLGVRSYTDAID